MDPIGIGRSIVHLHVSTPTLLDAEASYQCRKDFASSPHEWYSPPRMKKGLATFTSVSKVLKNHPYMITNNLRPPHPFLPGRRRQYFRRDYYRCRGKRAEGYPGGTWNCAVVHNIMYQPGAFAVPPI
jgi:hypothetical protein